MRCNTGCADDTSIMTASPTVESPRLIRPAPRWPHSQPASRSRPDLPLLIELADVNPLYILDIVAKVNATSRERTPRHRDLR